MHTLTTVAGMQAYADEVRQAGERLALVPTMGALHEGHLALVRTAAAHADRLVVSVFVNPTQFAPGEDYERYPRALDADRARLAALADDGVEVDVVFAPSADEMYPHGHADVLTWVTVDGLDRTLCGRYREGHFRGVTTVVTKLFLACRPHVAVFGQKDAQQLAIVRRMAEELLFGIEVVGVPIVREDDGLARSSRNVYLSPEERQQATVLYDAVNGARARAEDGERDGQALVEGMLSALRQAPDAEVQYAEVVDAATLRPLDTLVPGRDALAAVAVFFGDTRLIDNALLHVPGDG
jgi:pantoate--beta-alanine ligase